MSRGFTPSTDDYLHHSHISDGVLYIKYANKYENFEPQKHQNKTLHWQRTCKDTNVALNLENANNNFFFKSQSIFNVFFHF